MSGEVSSLGISFDFAGNDIIDAHNAAQGITAYGGAGNDTITGSQAGDHLFGGSGNDTIDGQGGADHIYGDNGINVDRDTRFISVVAVNASGLPNHDGLVAKQRHHQRRQRQRHHLRRPWPHRPVGRQTLRILTTGYVTGIVTVQPNNGGADTINGGLDNDVILGGALADLITGGEGNDIVFGDHGAIDYVIDDSDFGDIDRMFTIDNAIGAYDTINTGNGDDIVIGGVGGDGINAGGGRNLVFGDNALIRSATANTGRFGGLPVSLGQVSTIDPDLGGIDNIVTGSGDDIILGGNLGDVLNAGDGNNIVLGDDGVITFTGLSFGASGDGNDLDPSDIDEIVSTSTTAFGGADTIITGIGNDIILGGRAGDSIACLPGRQRGVRRQRASAPQPAVRPSWPSLPITLGILGEHRVRRRRRRRHHRQRRPADHAGRRGRRRHPQRGQCRHHRRRQWPGQLCGQCRFGQPRSGHHAGQHDRRRRRDPQRRRRRRRGGRRGGRPPRRRRRPRPDLRRQRAAQPHRRRRHGQCPLPHPVGRGQWPDLPHHGHCRFSH
ncbi:calcium-binding protein [Massilia sp. B-10]|nr:calcium-binding protein [Massilia sp. B-10]